MKTILALGLLSVGLLAIGCSKPDEPVATNATHSTDTNSKGSKMSGQTVMLGPAAGTAETRAGTKGQ